MPVVTEVLDKSSRLVSMAGSNVSLTYSCWTHTGPLQGTIGLTFVVRPNGSLAAGRVLLL